MNAQQLETLGGLAVTIISGVAVVVRRAVSASGKTIRRLRRNVEQLQEVVYDTRAVAISHGARRHELPRIPTESDEDFDDQA